ncbi:hypothetical protein PTSG_02852 [Salpingoeca rosetta]|uniref:Exportin-4 n=1 Tax=Salpingoeca rosetta (strain ATCC 50818 / BSB-021) TaxID=946362 RepID=F2U3I3_SALR5|nr:uncharacterized protein PTSG_02852 [Salpingoeca rosetta]EGD82177.1 hypothetical protein PTSG_02852 [Salpingoeca rosetta]|eukprot:XP_004996360.1 hypothetical protein PTSG_02852 [Salpingoeca rosetta]
MSGSGSGGHRNVDELLRMLTQAADCMMGVTPQTAETIKHAEQVFLDFKRTERPYELCFQILDAASNDYVIFETFEAIKEGVIREFSVLESDAIASIRDNVLSFITRRQGLASFAMTQGLACVAICFKLSWTHAGVADTFFEQAESLIFQDDSFMQSVGLSLSRQMLHEFSSSSKSSAVGLAWEFHLTAKRSFEQDALKRIFVIAVRVLRVFTEQQSYASHYHVLQLTLGVAEAVLRWQFCPASVRRLLGSFHHVTSPYFKPGPQWADVLVPNLCDIFFKLHVLTSDEPDLLHPTQQCLIQLGCVATTSFNDVVQQLEYLGAYLRGLGGIAQSLTQLAQHNMAAVTGSTTLAQASMLSSVMRTFRATSLSGLDEGEQKSVLNTFTALTALSLHCMTMEEDDDPCYAEAFDACLNGWLAIAEDESQVQASWQPYLQQVFQQYVDSRMQKAQRDALADEEVEEETEADDVLYHDQLCGVATLARVLPDQSLGTLLQMLSTKVPAYMSMLTTTDQDQAAVCVAHEEVHWLLLISAAVLADPHEGEVPLIPQQITALALQCEQSGVSNPAVSIVRHVFELMQHEHRCFDSGAVANLSPQVAASTMFFFQRVANTYLLLDESSYSQPLSASLVAAFKGEGGAHMLAVLFQKMRVHVVQLFKDVTSYWISPALSSGEHNAALAFTYTCMQRFLQEWAGANQTKVSSSLQEDEEHDEVLLVLQVLHELASTEYFENFDLHETGPGETEAGDVALLGINLVVPLLTTEMLQEPLIAKTYYALLDMACEGFPEKVYHGSAELLQQFVQSLTIGVQALSGNVARCSLAILQNLASVHLKFLERGHSVNPAFVDVVKHFQRFVFDWFVLQSFDMDLLDLASGTLFFLICCDMQQFEAMCTELIAAQPAESKERLSSALYALVHDNGLQCKNTRKNRTIFTKNFDTFLMAVRAFLVKR